MFKKVNMRSNITINQKVQRRLLERCVVTLFSEEASVSVDSAATEAPKFDTQIYVGNISFDTVESELRAAFSEHGTVTNISMPLNRETMKSRGFAFVTMSNADEHAAAIAGVDQTELGGRTVYASESLPKDQVSEHKKKYQANKQSKNTITKTCNDHAKQFVYLYYS